MGSAPCPPPQLQLRITQGKLQSVDLPGDTRGRAERRESLQEALGNSLPLARIPSQGREELHTCSESPKGCKKHSQE